MCLSNDILTRRKTVKVDYNELRETYSHIWRTSKKNCRHIIRLINRRVVPCKLNKG